MGASATFGRGNTPSGHGLLKSKDSEGTQLVSGLCLRGWGGVTQGSHNPLPHAFACPPTACNRPSNRQ